MPTSYIGLFPGRAESPMRIGGYMSAKTSEALAESPDLLRKSFEAAGFPAYNDEMLSICRDLYSVAGLMHFQFDIYPDGSLGDTFGLDISLLHIKPAEADEWLMDERKNGIFTKLKDYGLIDERYKKLAGASFVKGISAAKKDGSTGVLILSNRFSYVKVKFRAGAPVTTKLFLHLNAVFPENKADSRS